MRVEAQPVARAAHNNAIEQRVMVLMLNREDALVRWAATADSKPNCLQRNGRLYKRLCVRRRGYDRCAGW